MGGERISRKRKQTKKQAGKGWLESEKKTECIKYNKKRKKNIDIEKEQNVTQKKTKEDIKGYKTITEKKTKKQKKKSIKHFFKYKIKKNRILFIFKVLYYKL